MPSPEELASPDPSVVYGGCVVPAVMPAQRCVECRTDFAADGSAITPSWAR